MAVIYKADEETAALNVSQMKRLAKYLVPYKKQVAVTIILMFIATMTNLIGPYLLEMAIDVHIPGKSVLGLIAISTLYILALGVNYICNRSKIRIANKTGQMALYDIRVELFNKVQDLSFNFFDSRSAGRIMVRIVNDVDTLNNMFTNGIVNVITELSMVIVAAVLMFLIHPQLALITFIIIPFFMLGLFFTRNVIRRQWRLVRAKISNLNSYIHECISGMKVIQAYVRQRENRREYHVVIKDVFDSWMEAMKIHVAFGPAVEITSVLGTIIIFWYGARLLSIDGVTVGVLVAFTGYLKRFWHPVTVLSQFYNQLLVAMASSERIFELMDQKPQIVDLPGAEDLDDIKGHVEFSNVSFSYNEKTVVLKDINFEVNPGETIALVGATGSGKTTIINLLARFYEPVEGKVLIDGQDIRNVTIESLRKGIGVMLQDPFIFSGTIIDNIKYGKLDAAEDEVVRVAKMVNAHDFIIKMEDGYNTVVNERGSRLSIGQRQLIAFARVLLANPRILILDEATASIDTHTEILLQKAIDKVLKGRTSFVIAHRLSTIRNASRIFVVKDGEIIESGTHGELMKLEGQYCKLYNVQHRYLKAIV